MPETGKQMIYSNGWKDKPRSAPRFIAERRPVAMEQEYRGFQLGSRGRCLPSSSTTRPSRVRVTVTVP